MPGKAIGLRRTVYQDDRRLFHPVDAKSFIMKLAAIDLNVEHTILGSLHPSEGSVCSYLCPGQGQHCSKDAINFDHIFGSVFNPAPVSDRPRHEGSLVSHLGLNEFYRHRDRWLE